MKNLIILPFYFKIIGILLLLTCFLVYMIINVLSIDLGQSKYELLNQLLFSFSCLALFFLNFYKRKVEDDSWILKRLHCIFFSLFLGINFYILNSFLNVISDGSFYNFGGEIVFFILLFNLLQMIGLNRKIRHQEIDE